MPWTHITIARLEMTNFKRFYGHHSIDLAGDLKEGKSIILIGGDNGRGKTSIHEAINYALYEDDDLPGISTRPNYIKAVSDRLNRRALDEGRTDFSVAVELYATDNGAVRTIRIERQWEANVAERMVRRSNLRVFENERPVDFIEDSPAAYQDFLRSLIPPRIAPFFFFDGERIQDFADEDTHSRRMVEAIEDILHITVYKSLQDDLKKYVVDYIEKHEVKSKPTDDFFELQGERERIEDELEHKKDRLADIERELKELSREQRQIEDELRRIASPHASQRDELIAEQMRLNRELEEAKSDIHAGFEPLPLLLAGELLARLYRTLETEQLGLGVTTPLHVEALKRQLATLRRRVLDEPSPSPPAELKMTPKQLEFYGAQFDNVARETFSLSEADPVRILHDIGETGRQRILARIAEVESAGNRLKVTVKH